MPRRVLLPVAGALTGTALVGGIPAAVPAAVSAADTPAWSAARSVSAAPGGGPVGGSRLGSTAVVMAAGAPVLPAGITASSWLVADASSGAVLAARNPHGRFAPASTMKILTAVTLLPRMSARRTMTVTNADETVDGTKVGMVPGQRVSVDQLFTALLVGSANDAANVLGRAAGGTPVALRWMSLEARRLQALDTVPRTLHGLDATGQSSSAYDLALLGRAGMAMPAFRRYVGIRRVRMPAPGGKSFEISNHNRLLTRYPGAIGIKNGHTDAARSSLVAAARRGHRSILVTLMHADARMWQQAATLLDWGFRAAGRSAPVGTLVSPVPAAASRRTPVPSHPVAPGGPAARPTGAGESPPRTGLALSGLAGLAVAAAAGLLVRRRHRPS